MIRFVAVTALLIDSVLYARFGLVPAALWLAAAIVTARYMPKEY